MSDSSKGQSNPINIHLNIAKKTSGYIENPGGSSSVSPSMSPGANSARVSSWGSGRFKTVRQVSMSESIVGSDPSKISISGQIQDAARPKVLILHTGGTIAMAPNSEGEWAPSKG